MIDIGAAEIALIELAAAWRGWDRRATGEAVFAAKQAQWDLDEIFREAVLLLRRDDGEPADLRNKARHPLAPKVAVPPEVAHDGAELARQLYEHRRAGDGAAE
jgi:hypothetical protein